MITQRISPWMPLRTDKLGLNVQIVRWQDRADAALWPVNLNPTVYVLKDLWSTHDGNWNYQADARWTPPQWAIDEYLNRVPWGQPGYFDDAGGDHNLFAAVLGLDGKYKVGWNFAYGNRGVSLSALTEQGAWSLKPAKQSGWTNEVVWELYYPDQGQVGKWAVWPFGVSDIVVGGGMPYNNHVSTFAVYQEVARDSGNGGDTDPEPPPSTDVLAALAEQTALLRELRDLVKSGFRL